MYVSGRAAAYDERRNTSALRPPDPNALRRALEACADLRRRDPALVRWLEDGHPNMTGEEHLERFGQAYRR